MGLLVRAVFALLALGLAASSAYAQASITGVVRDTSGSVLPGVTVEAASPALIEKVRSVVTDGTGQYRIEQLRPGVYSVSFTLPGFNTFKRDGIELTGSFSATVNADLAVGSIEETVVVSGQSPIVDIQNARQQRVLPQDVLDAIPTSRTQFTNAVLIPGMNISTAQDVGGTNSLAGTTTSLSIHGGRPGDPAHPHRRAALGEYRDHRDASNFLPNMGSTQEMTVDDAAGGAEMETGGVRVNMVPKQGGNVLTGSLFATAVNDAFQSDNYTAELKAAGLRAPDAIKLNYDVNPSVGGPMVPRSSVVFASARFVANKNTVAGVVENAIGGRPCTVDDVLLDRERDVVVLRFGLDGHQHRTLEQIGKQFGLSPRAGAPDRARDDEQAAGPGVRRRPARLPW